MLDKAAESLPLSFSCLFVRYYAHIDVDSDIQLNLDVTLNIICYEMMLPLYR